ncbi:MAG: 50S ribosomal protein L32e [Candidatus Woesearchaeota archaeon]|jgi:large subunit ribosomal protein L32e|nr:50S ribosomal protein L32e [Candidatus Woesearchaeota archaeon]
MKDIKSLLELRRKLKKKKPTFIRQDAHKKPRIGYKWRRPNGSDSKMRRGMKGYRRSVALGWGSPNEVKGLHKSGLKMVIVHSEKDMDGLDSSKEGIIIGGTVGMRKKVLMLKKANEKGIEVLNVKNVDDYLKNVDELNKKKKSEREKIKKRRQKAEKKKEKEKDKLEGKLQTDEEKKEEEKKERDKVLTKKQV